MRRSSSWTKWRRRTTRLYPRDAAGFSAVILSTGILIVLLRATWTRRRSFLKSGTHGPIRSVLFCHRTVDGGTSDHLKAQSFGLSGSLGVLKMLIAVGPLVCLPADRARKLNSAIESGINSPKTKCI